MQNKPHCEHDAIINRRRIRNALCQVRSTHQPSNKENTK